MVRYNLPNDLHVFISDRVIRLCKRKKAIPNSLDKPLPAEKSNSVLQYLGNGRRGFLLVFSEGQEEVTIKSGDKVFVLSAD